MVDAHEIDMSLYFRIYEETKTEVESEFPDIDSRGKSLKTKQLFRERYYLPDMHSRGLELSGLERYPGAEFEIRNGEIYFTKSGRTLNELHERAKLYKPEVYSEQAHKTDLLVQAALLHGGEGNEVTHISYNIDSDGKEQIRDIVTFRLEGNKGKQIITNIAPDGNFYSTFQAQSVMRNVLKGTNEINPEPGVFVFSKQSVHIDYESYISKIYDRKRIDSSEISDHFQINQIGINDLPVVNRNNYEYLDVTGRIAVNAAPVFESPSQLEPGYQVQWETGVLETTEHQTSTNIGGENKKRSSLIEEKKYTSGLYLEENSLKKSKKMEPTEMTMESSADQESVPREYVPEISQGKSFIDIPSETSENGDQEIVDRQGHALIQADQSIDLDRLVPGEVLSEFNPSLVIMLSKKEERLEDVDVTVEIPVQEIIVFDEATGEKLEILLERVIDEPEGIEERVEDLGVLLQTAVLFPEGSVFAIYALDQMKQGIEPVIKESAESLPEDYFDAVVFLDSNGEQIQFETTQEGIQQSARIIEVLLEHSSMIEAKKEQAEEVLQLLPVLGENPELIGGFLGGLALILEPVVLEEKNYIEGVVQSDDKKNEAERVVEGQVLSEEDTIAIVMLMNELLQRLYSDNSPHEILHVSEVVQEKPLAKSTHIVGTADGMIIQTPEALYLLPEVNTDREEATQREISKFSFTLGMFFLLTMLNDTSVPELIHNKAEENTDVRAFELNSVPLERSWFLLSIIWYLSQIREQGIAGLVAGTPNGTKKTQQRKKSVKTQKTLLPRSGVIFMVSLAYE